MVFMKTKSSANLELWDSRSSVRSYIQRSRSFDIKLEHCISSISFFLYFYHPLSQVLISSQCLLHFFHFLFPLSQFFYLKYFFCLVCDVLLHVLSLMMVKQRVVSTFFFQKKNKLLVAWNLIEQASLQRHSSFFVGCK